MNSPKPAFVFWNLTILLRSDDQIAAMPDTARHWSGMQAIQRCSLQSEDGRSAFSRIIRCGGQPSMSNSPRAGKRLEKHYFACPMTTVQNPPIWVGAAVSDAAPTAGNSGLWSHMLRFGIIRSMVRSSAPGGLVAPRLSGYSGGRRAEPIRDAGLVTAAHAWIPD